MWLAKRNDYYSYSMFRQNKARILLPDANLSLLVHGLFRAAN